MHESYLIRFFIEGLYPPILKIYVKEQAPATLNAALACSKRWEEARVSEEYIPTDPYVESIPNPPSPYPTSLIVKPKITYKPPTPPPPAIVPIASNDFKNQSMQMTKKLGELEVKLNGGREKRAKTSNVRTNIWYSNCKGYGHLSTECVSPLD